MVDPFENDLKFAQQYGGWIPLPKVRWWKIFKTGSVEANLLKMAL